MANVREIIAERMVALRKSRGLSQSEFARRLGQARGTVFNWETARNKPDDEALLEVCRVLETSVSYLFGQTDDPRPAPDWHTEKGPGSASEAAQEEAADLLRQALKKLGKDHG